MNQILILLFVFVAIAGIGQSTSNQDWKAIQTRAKEMRKHDLDKAIVILDSLLGLDRTQVHNSTLAVSYKLRGTYLTRKGRIDEGIDELNKARAIFEHNDFKVYAGDCWFNIANARLFQGNMDDACAGYLEAIKVCTPCEDPVLMALGYSHLASAMFIMGETEEAETYLIKAEEFKSDKTTDSFIKATKAALAIEKGEIAEAEKEMREVLEETDPVEQSQSYAVAAANLIWVLDNTPERDRLARTVVELLAENPDIQAELLASSKLFEHYDEVGDSISAIAWYYKGVECAKRLGNEIELGTLEYMRAKREMARNDLPSALILLEEAVPLLIGSGAYGMAENAMNLQIQGYQASKDKIKEENAKQLLTLFQAERADARNDRLDLLDSIHAASENSASETIDKGMIDYFDNFSKFAIIIIVVLILMGILLRPRKQEAN